MEHRNKVTEIGIGIYNFLTTTVRVEDWIVWELSFTDYSLRRSSSLCWLGGT